MTLTNEKPTELLPCPFCNSEDLEIYTSKNRLYSAVWCNFCKTYGPDRSNEQQAAEAWNRRALVQQPAESKDHLDANPEPTARDVFEALSPLPEGSTCHVGRFVSFEYVICPTINKVDGNVSSWEDDDFTYPCDDVFGPDISGRPASAYVGILGDDYDAAYNKLTGGK